MDGFVSSLSSLSAAQAHYRMREAPSHHTQHLHTVKHMPLQLMRGRESQGETQKEKKREREREREGTAREEANRLRQ